MGPRMGTGLKITKLTVGGTHDYNNIDSTGEGQRYLLKRNLADKF